MSKGRIDDLLNSLGNEVARHRETQEQLGQVTRELAQVNALLARAREVYVAWNEEGLGSTSELNQTNWADAWRDIGSALNGAS